MQIEHEGQTITVWTQEEVEQETRGLKITNQNLKDEKSELADKLKEAKEAAQNTGIELATAQGDKEKAERLAAEIKADKEKEHGELLNTIKQKEIQAAISDLVTKHGAGGVHNEDLQDLIKSRYDFDYDIKTGQIKVSGADASSIEDLQKTIAESERYAAYRAGSGANGGGSLGNNGTGDAGKEAKNEAADTAQKAGNIGDYLKATIGAKPNA